MPDLDEGLHQVIENAETIARQEFADDLTNWSGEIPWEHLELLADRGYLGMNVDEEYGGAGLDEIYTILLIEAIGRVNPATARWFLLQEMVMGTTIEMFGSEPIKERYLTDIAKGEGYIVGAISEAEAGSDVASMTTSIQDVDGELVLNGEKTWVSEAPEATACVVWVRFDEGIGSVILDMDRAGIEIAQNFTNMAGETQSQLYFDDVVVPPENVLIRGEDQFKTQLQMFNWERLAAATMANATSMCALERAREYASQREQFGQPIGDFQGIEWKFADTLKRLQASRGLAFTAARRAHRADEVPDQRDASLAKLYAAETVEYVTSEALQIHGANGYQRGHDLEYLYRFARRWRIAGGTDEIQKNTVASAFKEDGFKSTAAAYF